MRERARKLLAWLVVGIFLAGIGGFMLAVGILNALLPANP